MAKRQTKADLERRIEELEAALERTERERDAALCKPGIVRSGWSDGKRFATTGKLEYLDEMWDAAHQALCGGDFFTEENTTHEHVVEPAWREDYPPNVDGWFVRYTYDDTNGISIEDIWTVKEVK